jgi:hypothetical protein
MSQHDGGSSSRVSFSNNLPVILSVAAVGIGLFAAYKFIKSRTIASLKVLEVDTKAIDHVKNMKLLENLFTLAGQAFDNIMKDGKANE